MTLNRNPLIVAPVTPMNRRGRIQMEQVDRLAAVLLDRGAGGFFVCGSTGEGLLLTHQERLDLAERWRNAVPAELPFIVHVGHACLEESAALARHAERIGASATAAMGPKTIAVRDMKQVVAMAAATARATPNLPFFYYYNGPPPGLPMTAGQFLEAASPRIPNLAGLKFTHHDLDDLRRCLAFDHDNHQLLFGLDAKLLPALQLGVHQAVGGTFNLTLPLAQQITDAYLAGQIAEAENAQKRLNVVIAVLQRFGGITAVKAAMRLLDVECGRPRLPLSTLTIEQEEQLLDELRPLMSDPVAEAATSQVPAVHTPDAAIRAD